jgi:general secretion pathway protein A
MYIAHFGLADPPFSLTPDPRFVYMSEGHREALAHLLYGIEQGAGFVQITGDVGTGKTTVCRCLLEQVPAGVDVALILNPRLTSAELLSALCDELRVAYPAGVTSLKTLVDVLYRYLLEAHERGRRTVLIVDEAQNLDPDVLEQLRLLTNLETTRNKLLQVVLIGQPELVTLLDRPALRQVAQRVTVRYHLRPFSARDTRAYVMHRLRVAGRRKPVFTERALRSVHRASGGVPRLVNVICDRALLGAYAREREDVDVGTVRRAVREVRGSARRRGLGRLWRWSAAAVAVAAVASGGVLLTPQSLAPLAPARAEHGQRSVAQGPPPATTDVAPAPGAAPAETMLAASTAAPPAPVSGDAPSAAIASSPGAPEPKLAQLLRDGSLRANKQEAFTGLLRRWGLEYNGGLACQQALTARLRCLFRIGTWERLRSFDMPAVIELTLPAGGKRYALLAALGEEMATLDFGGRQTVLPLRAIDEFWDGSFVLLWAPPVSVLPMLPGQRGRDVQWLRARLDEIDGRGTAAPGDVFDSELLTRVKAFQQRERLAADGVVGEETLARLVAMRTDPHLPRLAVP